MLKDKAKAEIEAYLLHRDKDFKLRQERAIHEHVDQTLQRRSNERRALATFLLGIGGTTLAGIIFFAWQTALGVVESRVSTAIQSQDEKFELLIEKADELREQLAISNERYVFREKQLTQLQEEAFEVSEKLSAFEAIPITRKQANENHKEIAELKLEIIKLETLISSLSSNFEIQSSQNITPRDPAGDCPLAKRIIGEC